MLDTARRENAARRDLLYALGFDDETQDRFIRSKAKRQAIHDIFQQDGDAASMSQMPGDVPAMKASELGQLDFADLDLNSYDITPQPMHTNNAEAVVNLNDSMVGNSHMDQWLFSPETLDKMLPSSTGPFGRDGWLGEPYYNAETLPPIPSLSSRQTRPQPRNGARDASTNGLSNGAQLAAIAPPSNGVRQTVDQCFLNTVVNLASSTEDSSTVCSSALSLIFRHNRKGLSMAALQEKLRPGMKAASESSGECRIEDSVLFQVLAEISAPDSQEGMFPLGLS